MRIIKVDSIAVRYRRRNGTMLKQPELQIYVPYGLPGNGWFIGAWNFNFRDVFSVRSMFRTVISQ